MELVDIPDQIRIAFDYSERSWKTSVISVGVAATVIALSTDLVFNFVATRVNDGTEPHYGPLYWTLLVVLSLAVPTTYAIARRVRAQRSLRRFEGGTFGIAIAPFQVTSTRVDTLAASTQQRAFEQVSRNFLESIRDTMLEERWSDEFEFRLLPAFVVVTSSKRAEHVRAALDATLLVWGRVTEQHDGVPRLSMHFDGDDLDLDLSAPLDVDWISPLLRIFALMAAAGRSRNGSDQTRALALLEQALPVAEKFEKGTTNDPDTGLARIIRNVMAEAGVQ